MLKGTESITDLPDIYHHLEGARGERARSLLRVYQTTSNLGDVNVKPENKTQQVIEVYNPWVQRRAAFNPSRSRRPKKTSGEIGQFQKEIDESKGLDPFCRFEETTLPGPFGRVTGRYGVTAANEFPSALYHGILIFNEHNPLSTPSVDEMAERFDILERWFAAAYLHSDQNAVFPTFIENKTPRAAASVIHGHGQMSLKPHYHDGFMERMKSVSQEYFDKKGRNYLDDLFEAHQDLGVGFEVDGNRVFASLTPIKEKESFVLIDDFRKNNIAQTIQALYQYYIEKSGQSAFNLLVGFRPFLINNDWDKLPQGILRFISRGNPWSANSDFGGYELMETSIISSDPYDLNRALQTANNC